MKNLILTLIITLPLTLWGQGWEQTYGNDISSEIGYDLIISNDGNYLVTGQGSGEYSSVWILKINSTNGDTLWTKKINLSFNHIYGKSIIENNNDIYLIGKNNSLSSSSVLIKTNNNGDILFIEELDFNSNQIISTNDNHLVVVGNKQMEGYTNIKVVKLNYEGGLIWESTISNTTKSLNEGESIIENDNNELIIGGNINSKSHLFKLSEEGDEMSSIQISEFGTLKSINNTLDNGIIISGQSYYSQLNLDYDVMVVKINNNDIVEWENNYSINNVGSDWYGTTESGNSIIQTSQNDYILCGETGLNNQSSDLFISKLSFEGDTIWTRKFGNNFTRNFRGFSIVEDVNDNSFVVTGLNNLSTGGLNFDLYILKVDYHGNITSTFEIPLPNPDRKLEKTINLKGQEVKPQTNTPIIEIFDDGSTQKKIIIE